MSLNGILGTTVEITSTMTVADGGSVDSATIVILDAEGDIVEASTAMVDEGSDVFSHIFQSETTDDKGCYEATITGVSGANTAKSRVKFNLEP